MSQETESNAEEDVSWPQMRNFVIYLYFVFGGLAAFQSAFAFSIFPFGSPYDTGQPESQFDVILNSLTVVFTLLLYGFFGYGALRLLYLYRLETNILEKSALILLALGICIVVAARYYHDFIFSNNMVYGITRAGAFFVPGFILLYAKARAT